MITTNLEIGGTVASFDTAAQNALKSSVASSLNCIEPACVVQLSISAGSVIVQVDVIIPDNSPAATDVSTIASSATTLFSAPVASISANLGVTVVSQPAAPVTQAAVPVALVVAPPPAPPPPPSPPPSPPKPPPPPSPAPPPLHQICGCDRILDGSQYMSVEAICTRQEGSVTVCRQQTGSDPAFGPQCPSDYTLCLRHGPYNPNPSGATFCRDSTTGRWANPNKCARKLRKNKCHKRAVATNCARTCSLCGPRTVGGRG